MFLTRNSSYSAAFSNENDDLSLQFSIDPDMYRKLGIKKAKRGEESSFDINKIYEFQLQRDIAKIKQSRGTYKERNNAFLHTRDKDPFYHELAKKSDLAIDGKFNELLEYTAEPSWKETSQPYGEIAHKRYIEYLNSIPPGPTPEMIQDVDQREQDNKLWKDIKYGRAEQTKRDLDVLDKRMKEKELMAFMEEFTGVDQAERERRTYIKKNQFEKLRKLPTMREQRESLHKWYSGVHYPYDIDKGFPIRSVINLSGKRASHDVMRDPDVYNKEKIYSSKRFLKGRESAETGYRQHMTNVNLKEAVKFLKSNQKIIDADILKNQTEKSFNMKNRRRAAQATADLATDAVLARVALFQKEHKFTKSLNKFDEFGMEITGKEYESSSSSASSSSSSSKDSNGQEVEDTIKKLDPNIAEVLQNSRGHAGIRNSSTFNRKSFFGNLQQPGNLFSLDKSATVAPKSESEDNQSVDSEKDLKRFFDSRGTKPGDRKHRRRRRGASAISHRLLKSIRLTASRIRSFDGKRFSPRRKKTLISWSKIIPRPLFVTSIGGRQRIYRTISSSKSDDYGEDVQAFDDDRDLSQEDFIDSKVEGKLNVDQTSFNRRSNKEIASFSKPTVTFKDEMNPATLSLEPSFDASQDIKSKSKKFRKKIRKLEKDEKFLTEKQKKELRKYRIRAQKNIEAAEERASQKLVAYEKSVKVQDFYRAKLRELKEKKKQSLQYRLKKVAEQLLFLEEDVDEDNVTESEVHVLKPFDKIENATQATELIQQRESERKAEHVYDDILRKTIGINTRRQKFLSAEDLVLAARSGDYKELIDILENKAYPVSPNDRNADGTTATYAALQMILNNEVLDNKTDLSDLTDSRLHRFKKFVDRRIRKKGKNNKSAGLEQVLCVLLYKGGDVDYVKREKEEDGKSIMHCAAEGAGLELLTWLSHRGSDINQLSQYGRTALMYAIKGNHLDTVMLLLKLGAMMGINISDKYGWTALHFAAVFARPEVAQVLVICGAIKDQRNKDDRTPVEEARARNRHIVAAVIQAVPENRGDIVSRLEYFNGAGVATEIGNTDDGTEHSFVKKKVLK